MKGKAASEALDSDAAFVNELQQTGVLRGAALIFIGKDPGRDDRNDFARGAGGKEMRPEHCAALRLQGYRR